MQYGISFHKENFLKWLDPHVYEALKMTFHWEIIHKLSLIC